MHVGESACGLHCHVILRSFSQVSLGRRLRPEPRFCGLREAGVGGEGVRGAGRAPRCRGCGLGSVEPPPPPVAQSAAVSGDFLCHGVGLGRCPAALDLGRDGGRTPAAAHPRVSGSDPAAAAADWRFPQRRGGRRRPPLSCGPWERLGRAALSCRGWRLRLVGMAASGRFRSLSDRTEEEVAVPPGTWGAS